MRAHSVRRLRTDELSAAETRAIRALMEAAFGPDEKDRFTEDDWLHAVGGRHFVLEADGAIAAHASVVPRTLYVAGLPLRVGYVEAVATDPARQRSGLGSIVMRAVGEHIAAQFELGALGTSSHAFYKRLGWTTWRGPSSVRTSDGERPTPDEDGYIMVLRTPSSPMLDLTAAIACEWRPGDVW